MSKAQKLLPREFFLQTTTRVARDLLGMELSTTIRGKKTAGIIVETEAYRGKIDPASHSYRGMTARNEVMFGPGGHIYVYFIYGMHYCVNIVTEKAGNGSAVLIRALEPTVGIDIMRRRRELRDERHLTNGPGKLCQALGIDRRHLGSDLTRPAEVRIAPLRSYSAAQVCSGPRIGISRGLERNWRYYVKNNRWVSK